MIIHEMPQGSDEWMAVRCGHVSASRFSDVLSKGQGKTRKAYMMKLLAERLSGVPQESYSNGAMEWGIETEPQARAYYEATNDISVEQVGFIEVNEYLGCSPDMLVGKKGNGEIKCPTTPTHLQYILDDRFPKTYKPQVQGQLWICEREWCDFLSYDPRVSVRPMFCIRVYRDEDYIKNLAAEVELFIQELKELEAQITTQF